MKLRNATLLLLAATLAAAATPFLAQDICQGVPGNLITNCGFETGDFSGWTPYGNISSVGVSGGPFAYSGIYGAFLGPVGSNGYLIQPSPYPITLWQNTILFEFRHDSSYWGLDSIVVQPYQGCGYNCEVFTLSFWLANFGGATNNFTTYWDYVNVGPAIVNADPFPYQQVTLYVTGTTPEPNSLILMASGLLGLVGMVRRRIGA